VVVVAAIGEAARFRMAAARVSMAECPGSERLDDGTTRRRTTDAAGDGLAPEGGVSPGRRFRGLGRGRRVRRTLAQGGSGPAQRLNQVLGSWPGVRITPMFGRWGYFVGDRLFACFPLRDKDRDLWIRLSDEDQQRALRETGVRPHRRFARRGWVETDIESESDVGRALKWLRRARVSVGHQENADEE
jgi:Luciferase